MATDSYPFPLNVGQLQTIADEVGTYPVRALLAAGYIPDAAHEFASDVTGELSGGSYARVDLSSVTWSTVDELSQLLADDATFASMTAVDVDCMVVFADRGADAVSPLVAAIVLPPFDVTAEPVTVRFTGGVVLELSEFVDTGSGVPDPTGETGKFLSSDGTDALWVQGQSDAIPQPPGTAAAGTDSGMSRGDHVHAPPSASDITAGTLGTARLGTGTANSTTYLRGDQTWATVSGSGDVVGPASAVDDRIATFDTTTGKLIQDGGKTIAELATLASPTFTGTPAAPTAAVGTDTTQVATTAFVQRAVDVNGPPPYPSASGDIIANFSTNGTTTCTNLAASGRLVMAPMWIGAGAWDRIWVYTGTPAVATWRLGWYPILSTGAPDWANVFDAGTVNMNAAAPSGRITISQTPGAGWYYGAILTDAYTANPTVNLYSSAAHQYRSWPQTDGGALTPAVYWTGVATGALPTTSPGTASTAAQMPVIRLRKA